MAKMTAWSTINCYLFHIIYCNKPGIYKETILIIIKTTAILKNIRNLFLAFVLNIVYTLPYDKPFTPAF
jgi:hypothetical protein